MSNAAEYYLEKLWSNGVSIKHRPIGTHVQLTVIASVTNITVPAGALYWMVCANTKDVRFTLDGVTNPTTSKGLRIVADAAPMVVPVVPGQVIKVIETASTSTLDYQFGY